MNKVYQQCPDCGQQYFARPMVEESEKETTLCKLCLEKAIIEEDIEE